VGGVRHSSVATVRQLRSWVMTALLVVVLAECGGAAARRRGHPRQLSSWRGADLDPAVAVAPPHPDVVPESLVPSGHRKGCPSSDSMRPSSTTRSRPPPAGPRASPGPPGLATAGSDGADSVIDAVGQGRRALAGPLADALAKPFMKKAGVDRLCTAIDALPRGGTISLIGVCGGATDPIPLLTRFDKQVQLRMCQADVCRWVGDILPLLGDDDPWAWTPAPPTGCWSCAPT
jgi:hypothetical protein